MKTSFVKIWAIAMTAMVLLLLGVLIGKLVFNQPEKQVTDSVDVEQAEIIQPSKSKLAESNFRPPETNGTGNTSHQKLPPSEMNSQAQYITPDELLNIKTEWRTEFSEDFRGFAALFDPQRRELIIEKCQHVGYFDQENQVPVVEGTPFCETFVYSRIMTLTAEKATLKTKTGELIEMTLALKNDNQLEISLLDTEIAFIPGSKNDLFQLMERTETMRNQKQALFIWQDEDYLKKLAEQKSRNSGDSP